MKQVVKLEKCVNVIMNALSQKKPSKICFFVINLCVTDLQYWRTSFFFGPEQNFAFSPFVSRQIKKKRNMGWQIVPKTEDIFIE